VINQFEKTQINKGRDITSARILSRIIKITIVVAIILLYGEHFGMSLSGLLTFGGIGGIAVGMAGKDILSNFFSGIMLYLTDRLASATGSAPWTAILKAQWPKLAGE
jgi:MscS family membrane protein